jgi:hypothetical protein
MIGVQTKAWVRGLVLIPTSLPSRFSPSSFCLHYGVSRNRSYCSTRAGLQCGPRAVASFANGGFASLTLVNFQQSVSTGCKSSCESGCKSCWPLLVVRDEKSHLHGYCTAHWGHIAAVISDAQAMQGPLQDHRRRARPNSTHILMSSRVSNDRKRRKAGTEQKISKSSQSTHDWEPWCETGENEEIRMRLAQRRAGGIASCHESWKCESLICVIDRDKKMMGA